jgi:cell division protein FtsQ
MLEKKKKIQKPNRRLNNQNFESARKSGIKLAVSLLVVTGLFGLMGYAWVSFSHQIIRRVDISSDGHAIELTKLRSLVDRYVTRDFYTLNTHDLQVHLSLLPWIKSVAIRRVWPDKLIVAIQERQAVALWNETQLLSPEGVLFQPEITTYPSNLPQLSGAEGDEKKVLKKYLILREKMRRLDLRVVALGVVGHSWKFLLDSGTKVYFNEDEKQQLSGFNKLFQRVLRGKMQRVEAVDLRYAGGASVRWKESAEKK